MALSARLLVVIPLIGCASSPPPAPATPAPTATTAVTVSVGHDGGYTMEDLRALASRGEWTELAAHADDVRPAQRDAAWQELADRAVIMSSKTTLAKCLDDGGEKSCTEKLFKALERHGSEADAFDAGKIVAAHYGGGPAMPFFERSLTGPNARAHCDDDALMQAMFQAFEARSPGPEDAKRVQATCRALRKH